MKPMSVMPMMSVAGPTPPVLRAGKGWKLMVWSVKSLLE